MRNILQEKVNELSEKRAIKIETIIKAIIKPKPKLLPTKIWVWLIHSLFELELIDTLK